MEMVLAIVTGVAAAGVVIQGMASYMLTQRREERHQDQVAEREKIHRMERDRQNKRLEQLDNRLVEQERFHQTERRELYERIQQAQVYTEPLLTGGAGSGTDKGSEPRGQDSEVMPAEELARLRIQENSDGGFIDTTSGVLYENVKALLYYRQEAEKEKKDVADALK